MKKEKIQSSRKWRLVLLIVFLTTLGTFAPTMISSWLLHEATPLVILNGGHFVTLITLVVSAYFGANVYQKKIENGQNGDDDEDNTDENVIVKDKDNEKGEA